MKIAFIPGSCVPFHGRSLESRPMGGIESAVIRLASALSKLGAEVIVFSKFDNPPLTNPLYLPLRAIPDLGAIDILISVRELAPLFLPIQAKKRYFWTGDSHNQLQHLGLGDSRVVSRLDAFLPVSTWHADTLAQASGFPRDRCWILRNGVDQSLFTGGEIRGRKRLIYSSTPYRGLSHLPGLFSGIAQQHQDAELHIYSGFAVYAGAVDQHAMELQYAPLFKQLSETKGTYLHGNILQHQLAREFMRSTILAYPNTFEETSCITALEAMAGGCVPVTTNRAALKETVGGGGIIIDGEPGSPTYDETFIDTVNSLLSNDELIEQFRKNALIQASHHTWGKIAAEFLDFLRARLSQGYGSNLEAM